MALRPYMFTLIGGVLGVIASAAWIATFHPHGSIDLSWEMFPLARAMAGFWTDWAVPAPVWYVSMLLHWPVVGALVDFTRGMLRGWQHVESPPNSAQQPTRPEARG